MGYTGPTPCVPVLPRKVPTMREGPFGIKLDGWDGKSPKPGAGEIVYGTIIALALLAVVVSFLALIGCGLGFDLGKYCQ
jgi:hypothetical protein